ncbi:MAG: hypothetical protein KKC77_19575 [Proteobacteria bacterium]|nr:hypothetical protein [Pseudomonadota bacterium]
MATTTSSKSGRSTAPALDPRSTAINAAINAGTYKSTTSTPPPTSGSSGTTNIGGTQYPSTMTAGQIIDVQRATGQLKTPTQVASSSGWQQSYAGLKPQGTTVVNQQTGTATYTPYASTSQTLQPAKPLSPEMQNFKTATDNYMGAVTGFSLGLSQAFYPSLYYEQSSELKTNQLINDFKVNPTNYPTTSTTLPSGETQYTLSPDYFKDMQKQYYGEAKKTYSSTTPTSFKFLGGLTEATVGLGQTVIAIGNWEKNIPLQFAGGGIITSEGAKQKTFLNPFGETQSSIVQKETNFGGSFDEMPVSTITGNVAKFAPVVIGLGYGGYQGIKSVKSFKAMGLTTGESIGQTLITSAEAISPLKFGTDATDIAQLTRASNYFNKKSLTTPATGTRYVSTDTAIDIYGKKITNPIGGSFEQQGITQSKLVTDKYFFQAGGQSTKLTVPTTSGRIYSFSSTEAVGAKGMLLPEFKGLTPSIAKSENLNIYKVDTMSMNGKTFGTQVNLFNTGFAPTKTNIGGATRQVQGSTNKFVLSKSGALESINTKVSLTGPLDTMQFDVAKSSSMKFKNTGVTILKIKEITTGGGGLSSATRTSGGNSLGGTTQIKTQTFKAAQLPTQTLRGTSTLSLPKATTGLGTSISVVGLTSGTRTESLSIIKVKSIPSTRQIPTTTQYTIPLLANLPATRTITSVTQVQATKVTTIPATITTPVFGTPTGFGSPNTITPFAIPPIPIIIPPFSLGMGWGSGIGKLKTKAKYGYTPSFTALALGIKGKARKPTYKGKYTGLELRPITKGWNIMKALKGSK